MVHKSSKSSKYKRKTYVTSVSVASLFPSTKHKYFVCHFSSDALADLLRKTDAKCDLKTINITSLENTQENTCRTQFVQ